MTKWGAGWLAALALCCACAEQAPETLADANAATAPAADGAATGALDGAPSDATASPDAATVALADAPPAGDLVPAADAAVAAIANADGSPTDAVAVDAPAADAAPVDASPPFVAKQIYKTFIGDWKMKPKGEITKCVLKRLDNAGPMWVNAIATKITKGSHHLIVYRSDAKDEVLEPFECTPFAETLSGDNVPLLISQVSAETFKLPPGVAFKFVKNQMIRLESHYFNYSTEEVTAHGDVEFHTLQAQDFKHEADLIFYGSPDFNIPKGKTYSTPWNFIDVWPDTKVFALTGHTHKLGTNVEIAHYDGTTPTAPKPEQVVYPPKGEPYSWEEPPTAHFEPPTTFKPGHGLAYRCTWNNTTDQNVGFGESANKEMCFLWGYYFPSKGYRMCINPGKWANRAPGLITDPVCCPDSAICPLIKSYLSKM
ncbi:MAG: hypothetical protein EXR79_05865 [Myxococcales bacterium]|nr:hypothetical protein [Myxococcales bacterium]